MKILGIGSRIKHVELGLGVITNVTNKHYWVTFIENGIETIDLDSDFEVIEAVDVAVTKGIIKQGGAWFSFEDSNKDPQKLQGRERVYEFFREDKEFNYLKSLLSQQPTTELPTSTDTKEESDD
mgnify:CR=1 FL=1